MKKLIYLVYFLLLPFNLLHASEISEEYISPKIQIGQKFHRDDSAAYLKCYDAREASDMGFGNFSFEIIAKKGTPFEERIVGKIGVRYSQKSSPWCHYDKVVEIGSLNIDPQFRKNGYGEAAVRTIIGVFKAKSRAELNFNRFILSVALNEDKAAARALYSKIGFQVFGTENTDFLDMELKR